VPTSQDETRVTFIIGCAIVVCVGLATSISSGPDSMHETLPAGDMPFLSTTPQHYHFPSIDELVLPELPESHDIRNAEDSVKAAKKEAKKALQSAKTAKTGAKAARIIQRARKKLAASARAAAKLTRRANKLSEKVHAAAAGNSTPPSKAPPAGEAATLAEFKADRGGQPPGLGQTLTTQLARKLRQAAQKAMRRARDIAKAEHQMTAARKTEARTIRDAELNLALDMQPDRNHAALEALSTAWKKTSTIPTELNRHTRKGDAPPRHSPGRTGTERSRAPLRKAKSRGHHGHKAVTPSHGHKAVTPSHGHKAVTPSHGHKVVAPSHGHKAKSHQEFLPAAQEIQLPGQGVQQGSSEDSGDKEKAPGEDLPGVAFAARMARLDRKIRHLQGTIAGTADRGLDEGHHEDLDEGRLANMPSSVLTEVSHSDPVQPIPSLSELQPLKQEQEVDQEDDDLSTTSFKSQIGVLDSKISHLEHAISKTPH